MSTLRRRWRFTGTVQGVGFRYYARAAALDALVPLIERTNRWARIENIETATLPLKEHEYGFEERSGD